MISVEPRRVCALARSCRAAEVCDARWFQSNVLSCLRNSVPFEVASKDISQVYTQ